MCLCTDTELKGHSLDYNHNVDRKINPVTSLMVPSLKTGNPNDCTVYCEDTRTLSGGSLLPEIGRSAADFLQSAVQIWIQLFLCVGLQTGGFRGSYI